MAVEDIGHCYYLTPVLILALDTTTRAGSCAIAQEGTVVREEASSPNEAPATRLPGDLMMLLADSNLMLDDVDAFAVATGPGSFTGLRIGIATMQGLAFATGKPLIGISGFAALAASAAIDPGNQEPRASTTRHPPSTIRTWVDAWRGEVYSAVFEGPRQVRVAVVAPPDRLLREVTGECTFVGDGAATYRPLIEQTLGRRARFADPLTPRLAGHIARLAWVAAQHGELPPPHVIRPLYVRRPDAELARERP